MFPVCNPKTLESILIIYSYLKPPDSFYVRHVGFVCLFVFLFAQHHVCEVNYVVCSVGLFFFIVEQFSPVNMGEFAYPHSYWRPLAASSFWLL